MIYPAFKRLGDIVISLAGLVLLSPVLLLTALAVKLDSPGPALFLQERLGLHGRPFRIWKFRSMTVGAESGGVYEKKGDARVTRVGRLIRALSIDELPQFVNILRGEMSAIGPRPVLTYHPWPLGQYTEEQKKRFLVRPGVTGWAQVNGRKEVPWDRRIEFDLYYVANRSLFLDLRILFLTVVKVLAARDNLNTFETAAKSLPAPGNGRAGSGRRR